MPSSYVEQASCGTSQCLFDTKNLVDSYVFWFSVLSHQKAVYTRHIEVFGF